MPKISPNNENTQEDLQNACKKSTSIQEMSQTYQNIFKNHGGCLAFEGKLCGGFVQELFKNSLQLLSGNKENIIQNKRKKGEGKGKGNGEDKQRRSHGDSAHKEEKEDSSGQNTSFLTP